MKKVPSSFTVFVVILLLTSCSKQFPIMEKMHAQKSDTVITTTGRTAPCKVQTWIDSSFATQTTILGGASNTPIGKWQIMPVCDEKVQTILITPQFLNAVPSDGTLMSLSLYFNGAQQVGQTQPYYGGSLYMDLDSSVMLMSGMINSFEVRASMLTASGAIYTSGIIKCSIAIPRGQLVNPVTGEINERDIVFPTTSGLTIQAQLLAMLAPDNPASNYVIEGQAIADLIHVKFTGNGAIQRLEFERIGLSNSLTLTQLYLYDGNTRISDGAAFTGAGTASFYFPVPISVTTALTLTAKADIGYGTNGQTVGLKLKSFQTTVASTSTNVQGNLMSVASASFTTIHFGQNTIPLSVISGGFMVYKLWNAPMQVNVHQAFLKGMNFKITGSLNSNALTNAMLYIDGVQVSTTPAVSTINGGSYLMFDLH